MKKTTSKQSWKSFWNPLPGTNISAKQKKRLSPERAYSSTLRRLNRFGISKKAFALSKKYFERYKAEPHLQFYKFCQFYCLDPEIIRKWTNSENDSEALIKYLKLVKEKREISDKRRNELILLNKLVRKKREIIEYTSSYKQRLNKNMFSKQEFSNLFSFGERFSNYSTQMFHFDGFIVFGIRKSKGENKEFQVVKFIFIKKARNKLIIRLAVDNNREKNKVLNHLSKKLNITILRQTQKVRLTKLKRFLESGASKHFQIVGVELVEGDTRLEINPQYSKYGNIAQSSIYKEIVKEGQIIKKMAKIRLTEILREHEIARPISILFSNFSYEDIVGGIKITLDGRGLNLTTRERLQNTFNDDFNIVLGIPILYKIDRTEIYKRFFSGAPRMFLSYELISPEVLSIENKLLEKKLLPQPDPKIENYRYCSDQTCPNNYIPFWTHERICTSCKNNLRRGRYSLEYKIIVEEEIRNFIYNLAKENGYKCLKLTRQLANRKILPLEVRHNSESICLIIITKNLNPEQVELLKYKYPNGVLITSTENKSQLQQSGVAVVKDLYLIIHDLLEKNPKTTINRIFDEVASEQTNRLQNLSKESLRRIRNITFYRSRAKLGPAFFEADVNILINYIFRNSVWLGSNFSGRKLPDSVSAFPVNNVNKGCFIVDAKFCEDSFFDMGPARKNSVYVGWGKNNKSIQQFGGLKGFIFISNKPPVNNVFRARLLKVIDGRHIFGSCLNTRQLSRIYRFYNRYEDELNRSISKKNYFLGCMELIFTKPNSYKKADKVIVWRDNDISKILRRCRNFIKRGGPTRISA